MYKKMKFNLKKRKKEKYPLVSRIGVAGISILCCFSSSIICLLDSADNLFFFLGWSLAQNINIWDKYFCIDG